ncbi:MAG: sulfite exporter TauE/SafE family protein, partial [Candidatus Marinimicrobia bacterium]|nr:sulfite exporter TauE/SafE family protein [Candidatus Neomarinimicrobiota bacterium]
ILLLTLVMVAIRIYIFHHLRFSFQLTGSQKWIFIFGLGGFLGFIAGTVGIGGGIYLVPLIIMFRLGSEKEAAASGAIFIWVNSLVGVIARTQIGAFDPQFILPLAGAVMLGGFAGSYMGAVRFNAKTIQQVMGGIILIAILFLIKGIL